jgi:hypothetical protein
VFDEEALHATPVDQFRIAVRNEDDSESRAKKEERQWLQRSENLHRDPPGEIRNRIKRSGILAEKEMAVRRTGGREESGTIFVEERRRRMGKVKTVGVVNGGGDAPGLNAAIRAFVRSAIGAHGMRVIGIHNGFDGLIWPEGAVSIEEAFSELKVVDPASEIVHAARAIGTTIGDCA